MQDILLENEVHTCNPYQKEGLMKMNECVFKKCCEKYKKKEKKRCKKCPNR